MAWNGSGTYTRTNGTHTGAAVWADDKTAGAKILASRHDTHDQDVATAINACLTKNGENSPSAHLSYLNTQSFVSSTGGSSNAYTVTLSPAPAAYYTGMTLRVILNHTNSGAATVNVNAIGAKDIKRLTGQALIGNELISGQVAMLVYDGTNFVLVGQVSPSMIGPFYYGANPIAANSSEAMLIHDTPLGAEIFNVPMLGNRTIVGITAALNAAISAGTLTLEVYDNGIGTGKTLAMTSGTVGAGIITPEAINSGVISGILLTTNGSFSSSATICAAYLWVV